MPGINKFNEYLKKEKVDQAVIKEIMGSYYDYDFENNKPTNEENLAFYIEAMDKAEGLLSFETLSKIMFGTACCKSDSRLKNVRQFAKDNTDKTLEEKVELLSAVQYMSKPYILKDGSIITSIDWKVNDVYKCACWCFSGKKPETPMPLSYCLCCAGHFKFHYQKALGVKLNVREVVSSPLNSDGVKPCVFVYDIK